MHKLQLLIFIFIVLFSSVEANTVPIVDFQVFVLGQSEDRNVEIYGTFSTKEGRHGGMELVFFREHGTFSIHAIEDIRSFIPGSLEKDSRYGNTDVDIILNLFVMPSLTRDGAIHLSGSARIMENTSPGKNPLYGIAEEFFTGIVANGGDTVLSFHSKPSGKEVNLRLIAKTDDLTHLTASPEDIGFDALFSLYNEDDDRLEIEYEPCKLLFSKSNHHKNTKCSHRRMFNLDNGETLLYMVIFSLEDAYKRDNGMVHIKLNVERWFYVNPKTFFADQLSINSERTSFGEGVRTLEQTISIDGKKRRVETEIIDGTVTRFKWDNIVFNKNDIIRNWSDIISILIQIEKGKHIYRPPQVEGGSEDMIAGKAYNLIGGPKNITGSTIVSSTYSKEIEVQSDQNIEIKIPLKGTSLLPFSAHEVIKMHWPGSPDSQK